ncbi:selenoprotein F [Copidosoma floridanum]|uniref:selenoprotein F n=1 Tax=Copidosoma floridanum TaxID=29053 RepID=UPI0006C9B9CD|nr:selenoprotein F [Copidosoma floridanum]
MTSTFTCYIFFLLTVTNCLSEYSDEECSEAGFNKDNLVCSTCKLFPKFNLPEFYDNCTKCCMEDEDYTVYAKAILEMCNCKFGAYPQIQAFIQSDRPKKYKNLQIKHVNGLDPIIKLKNEEGKVVNTLDITKWTTDNVVEFLDLHLLGNIQKDEL